MNPAVTISPRYFHCQANGLWNGLISDLLEERADTVVTALDLSHARSLVVDFCLPFMKESYIFAIRCSSIRVQTQIYPKYSQLTG